MEEYFDIVDECDQVIGQASRADVHREKLLHRAVHILVFDRQGRLLIQLRSAGKDEFPLCYTSSASGHVSAGETYDVTAVRELQEELGMSGELEFLTVIPASAETANEFTAVYRLVSDQAPTPDPEEIESLEVADLVSLAQRIHSEPQRFSPPFRTILNWYLSNSSPT